MSIESPQTYGEFFWKMSVDALNARAEEAEKTLSPLVSNIFNSFPSVEKLPPSIKNLFDTMSSPPAPSLDNVVFRFLAELGSGVANRILGHELKDFDYAVNEYLQNIRITPETANTLMLRKKINETLWKARQNAGGFSELEAAFSYEAQKPYPNLSELITYGRYVDNPDNPKQFVWSLFDISPSDYPIWEWLSIQKLNTEQVLSLFRRQFWDTDSCNLELSRLGWKQDDRQAVLDLAYTIPNAMLLVQGGLMQDMDMDSIKENVSKADIHPDYVSLYLDGLLTKPAVEDVIRYELRKDSKLSELNTELKRIGIHPYFYNLYKELAYDIPPVQDIITMAVREAFTPEIASRFGQYDDLPQEYVTWVGKKGISDDWAKRYWAAHWSLPSAQQGFGMLHRGIIKRDDLILLLRALDIMPFWRDKLIEMAYQPLTRVDVRRMYSLGVIDKKEVNTAYRDLGYNEVNADRLTEFVVKSTQKTLSQFGSRDIIKAYVNHLITEQEARRLLVETGLKSEEVGIVLETARHKRDWDYKEEQINAIENLYKKGRYDETKTRTELAKLNLTTDHITILLQQWLTKADAEKSATWTATQTLSFLKKGLITQTRAREELRLLDYDEEHIRVYLESVNK